MAASERIQRLTPRALTGWEEEYIERHQSDENTARLCNEVLARCLVVPGDDPGDARQTVRTLLVAERDRELVALRRMSLGPKVAAQVTCPACGEVTEAEFSLDALPLAFDPPPVSVTVALGGGREAELRLPTAGDQEDLIDAGLEGEAERRSWLIGRCLERYGERRQGLDGSFARELPVAERRAMEAALEDRLPDLDLTMAVECSGCAEQVTVPFDVSVFFFSS